MKKISVILVIAIVFNLLLGMVSFAASGDNGSENYPVWYLRENFGSASSWDKARAWNGTNYTVGSGLKGVELTDNSDWQKSEAYHALNIIDSGLITLDFDFAADRYCDNVGFRLLNGTDTVFGIVTKGTNLYLEQPGGQATYLSAYDVTAVNKERVNYVIAHIDMDNKLIKDVYINGKKRAENKPLATNSGKIDAFDVETDEAGKVVIVNQRVYIHKGFIVRDDFYNAQTLNDVGWEFEKSGGELSVYSSINRNADRYSMQMNTSEGGIKAIRKFDAAGGHLIFETSVLQPVKRGGIKISVNNGGSSVMSVMTDGTNFRYASNGGYTPFYDYRANAWYVVKFDMDLNSSTAKLYLNNKLKAENISLGANFIDNITIEAEKNDNAVIIDDVKLYHPQEYTEDYVPAPVRPEKADDSFLFGMQMCPLWTEGLYTKSWDYVKAAPDRLPILGAYDEGNPEVNDWEIKWLIDHGYDFQWVCHYPSYQMNYSNTAVPSPIKPDMCRDGNALYEGFMNARYSKDFKFAIVMENSFLRQGAAILPYFFDAVVPFWIEYYFKDDRYLKVDGRPVVSIYLMDDFLNMFEGMDGLKGAEAGKAGIEKFQKMCVDAGVGEPYILSQANAYPGKSYAYYSQCGIDGINTYGYDQQATLGQQRQILEAGLQNSKQFGVDTLPCLVPRRGDDPWLNGQNSCGYKSSPEEFEAALNWVKTEFAGTANTKLSKQLVMTATWDEFGEGHNMCPSVGDGFKYLDSVRKVFCKNYEHNEAIPTDSQKKRVNRLVVQNRKPGFLTDSMTNAQILENPAREIPGTVKKEWVFPGTDGEEDWKVASHISDNSMTPEGWVLNPSGNKPTINIAKKISYDISDVTYIRIRMKQSKSSTGGYAYWITSVDGDYSEKNMAAHFSASVDGSDEYRDYYIPVGEKIRWKANLTGLRITLGVVTDTADSFIVKSIALMSDDKLTNSAKLSLDGANYVIDPEPVLKNGTVMLPLREVCTAFDMPVENYWRTKSYLIRGDNQVLVSEGNVAAKKNKSSFALSEAPYRVSEVINDTLYVPMNVFYEATGRKISYDQKSKTVSVESKKSNIAIVNRKILGELTGGDPEGFYNLDGVNKISYENGITRIESGGYATPLSRAFSGINMDEVKVVAFKFTSSASGSLKFLYSSHEDPLITADKASRAINVSAGENYIEEPTSALYNWTGTANIFRFQPPASKTIELEWIRFLGDPLPVREGEADMSRSMTFEEEYCSWEFDKNTALDGWVENKNIGNLNASGGTLGFTVAGTDPALSTAGKLGIEASKISSIDIALRNNTAGSSIKLSYLKADDKSRNNENTFDIPLTQYDQYDKVYHIDVSEAPGWNGIIDKLILVPEGRKGNIYIDYIRLNYTAE